MNRRLIREWARWLLPLLVARAFLPAGFMLAANAGALELAFCPDVTAFVHQHSSAGDHSAESGEHHRGHHADAPCPFALAAVAAAVDVPHFAPAVHSTDEVISEPARVIAQPGPVRADRIRGPPFLS